MSTLSLLFYFNVYISKLRIIEIFFILSYSSKGIWKITNKYDTTEINELFNERINRDNFEIELSY